VDSVTVQRNNLSGENKKIVDTRRVTIHTYHALQFQGAEQYLEVPSTSRLNLEREFTITAWVKFNTLADHPLLDRGGVLSLGIKKIANRCYLELCISKNRCWLGTHPMVIDNWYHIAVSFFYDENPGYLCLKSL
jgi:hypothetical protein